MRKFPKIKYPSDSATDGLMNGEVVVTEKLDGANFRFTWDEDGTLMVGTRNHTYEHDDENIPKAFYHAVEYVKNRESDLWGFGNLTLYGEAMHLHSLQYEDAEYYQPSSGPPHFAGEYPNVVLFDARMDGEWMDWDEFTDIVDPTEFARTRVLERGNPDDLSFDVPEESMFGGPPEGIVARRVDGSVRAKKVTDNFKETNATAFNDPSKAQSDAAEFVAMYVTPQRIEKQAHKLVDEGEYDSLKMDMMRDLPRVVLSDVMAEEGWNLLTSSKFEAEWDDDFKGGVRSKTSKKCARVLKQEVQSF